MPRFPAWTPAQAREYGRLGGLKQAQARAENKALLKALGVNPLLYAQPITRRVAKLRAEIAWYDHQLAEQRQSEKPDLHRMEMLQVQRERAVEQERKLAMRPLPKPVDVQHAASTSPVVDLDALARAESTPQLPASTDSGQTSNGQSTP